MVAGIAILEEKGMSSLSLREVARRAGVSHAAPYHHFSDKDALVAAIATRGYEMLQRASQEASRDIPQAIDGLRQFGIVYASFAARHPSLFRLMYTWERRGDLPTEQALAGTGINDSMIEGIQQATGCSLEEARMIHLTLWAGMHGLVMLWLDGQLRWLERPLESITMDVTRMLGRVMTGKDPD